MTAREFAFAIRQPYSTVARWLERWAYLRVEGVAKVPARGRGGAWRLAADLPARWRAGDLPSPYTQAAA